MRRAEIRKLGIRCTGAARSTCAGILNVLQPFPSAAWDDISAAKLDPVKVVVARKLEIEFSGKEAGVEEYSQMDCEKERVEDHQAPMD